VTAFDRILIADYNERNPFRSIFAEEQRHTTFVNAPLGTAPTVGMASPTGDTDNDTSTIVYTIRPQRITYAYTEVFSNCTSWTGGWYTDNRTEAEKRKAWQKYWQGLYRKPRIAYVKLQDSRFFSSVRSVTKIPGIVESRKKALSPAMHSHRRFMAKMMKPVSQRCC